MNTKKCSKCLFMKEMEEFAKDSNKSDGISSSCKECKKLFYIENKERIKKRSNNYYHINRISILSKQKMYEKENRENSSKREKLRIQNDLQFKLRKSLRIRLNKALRGSAKSGSAINDLGCSIEFFKSYLESKFQPGMSWDNYGFGHERWTMDHIIPLSRFNLSDRDQFLVACNYSNIQPLWYLDNVRKGNK
jgi:hypothetical protein